MQAIPDLEPTSLQATEGGISERIGRRVGFGDVTNYAKVPAGEVTFELGGTEATETLRNRKHYTVVAMREGGETLIPVLQDGGAEGGRARLRVMNAAPELGPVDVRLGGERVGNGVASGEVSGYTSVGPGAYALNVMNPADGSTIAARGAVALSAGTSSTAFVIGTAGEPIDVVVADDRTAAPRGAPATGLGGLADGDSPVLLALLAGFLAALSGAAAYVALSARSRRGGL